MARRWPDRTEANTHMIETLQLSEETVAPARLRVDVHGSQPLEHVLDDMNFLNYRLADVHISPEVSLAEPDMVWRQDGEQGVAYDGRRMTFTGPGPRGRSRKSSSRCSHSGWKSTACIPFIPRRSAIGSGRSSFSAASRTTASQWARSRPVGAARNSYRPRRP